MHDGRPQVGFLSTETSETSETTETMETMETSVVPQGTLSGTGNPSPPNLTPSLRNDSYLLRVQDLCYPRFCASSIKLTRNCSFLIVCSALRLLRS